MEDAKKYQVRYHWKLANGAAYLIARQKGWLEDCCSHMKAPHGRKWTIELCKEDAKTYKYRSQWQRESTAYKAALRLGCIEECCEHMEPAPPAIKWELEKLQADAQKYTRIVDWQRGEGHGYAAALRRGLLDQCIGHMDKAFEWTLDLCLEDAQLYESRGEWKDGSGGAYGAAIKKGWYDECTKHMKKYAKACDNDVLYLWEVIGVYDEDGVQVYKVGVSSERLHTKRIQHVARLAQVDYKIIRLAKVRVTSGLRASAVESLMLLNGEPFDMGNFGGCSEFRSLSSSELNAVLDLIDDATDYPIGF